ncbi:MAG TPA: membrane protein insertion efficiency factor YidD [Candidatus Nitrosotenuis sp.]|nr:membrane protein insertion efficiency factor YidD [Candidatus Nitrosotenuis sp.]
MTARLLILAVRIYQATLGVWLGGACRFSPSCSQYAVEAIQRHGARRGLWLALARVLRCRPLSSFGYDPVPEQRSGHFSSHPHMKEPAR